MSRHGRNDPCPCGSGKKYKHCCAAKDEQRSSMARLLGPFAKLEDGDGPASDAGGNGAPHVLPSVWEVDALPTGSEIANDHSARPVTVLVAAEGHVLYADVEAHPPSEPDDVAALLGRAIAEAAQTHGRWPTAVRVRYPEVAAALAPRLAEHHVAVRAVRELPTIEVIGIDMRHHMTGLPRIEAAVSAPATWAAWGLPKETIGTLFSAAADFWRARPWAWLADDQHLRLDFPTGGTWTATVLGNGGEMFGIALYEDARDIELFYAPETLVSPFAAMQSAVLSLSFDAREDLPRPMQREVSAAGWEVADARAYPTLWALNTPAGGISRVMMGELIASLHAVARFAAANTTVLQDPARVAEPFMWTDAESGVLVAYEDATDDDFDTPWAQIASPWEPPVALTISLPMGPGAGPSKVRSVMWGLGDATPSAGPTDAGVSDVSDASQSDASQSDPDLDDAMDAAVEACKAEERRIATRFGDALLASGDKEARVQRDVADAALFIDCMVEYQGIGLSEVTEYDLRVFLYDWLPSKVRQSRSAATNVRGSLRRFFAYLMEHEGIAYPWAHGILRDKAAFEQRWDTFPGGFWWDEDVRAWKLVLYDDLSARVLLPSLTLAEVGLWNEMAGPEEMMLRDVVQRLWLLWREDLIRRGVTEPAAVRAELVERQRAWEREPLPAFGGLTTYQVVALERERMGIDREGAH